MRCNLVGLLFQPLDCDIDGCASDRSCAAAESSYAVLNNRSVAVNDCHVTYVNAKFVSGNLREACLLSLTVRRCACQNCHLAGRLYSNGCALPTARWHRLRRTERADFNVSRNAYADNSSFIARTLLLFAQACVVRVMKSLVERGFVVAAIVEESRRGLERKLIGLRKIPAPDFDRIKPKLCGN